MTSEEFKPVRCESCAHTLAVRSGDVIVSSLLHRNRKKEIQITLLPGQDMKIVCDRCGRVNLLSAES